MRKLLICFLILGATIHMNGQSSYEVGFLPEINVGKSLTTLWAINVELAPRYELAAGMFNGDSEREVYFGLLDVTTVFERTVFVDSKIGMGHLARFENNQVAHRLIQQYSFTNPQYGYRLGHRFRVDETFTPEEAVEIRLRYRLSSDISLNGEFIDPREIYLKIGNEYVYSVQGDETDLEIRVVPVLGYYLNDDHKIELGLDYRIDSFLDHTASHRFWLNLGYYLSL